MPSAAELLARAAAVGVAVETRRTRLHLRGKRETEPLVRAVLARKDEVLALPRGDGPAGVRPAPTPWGALPAGPEADALLAEVLALDPRVNANWQSYIRTRLEVDTSRADRLRRVRDWTVAHAELAPTESPNRDAPAGAAGN